MRLNDGRAAILYEDRLTERLSENSTLFFFFFDSAYYLKGFRFMREPNLLVACFHDALYFLV